MPMRATLSKTGRKGTGKEAVWPADQRSDTLADVVICSWGFDNRQIARQFGFRILKRMNVQVDESGRHHQIRCVYHALRWRRQVGCDIHDLVATNSYVRAERGAAGAVNDAPVLDQKIVRLRLAADPGNTEGNECYGHRPGNLTPSLCASRSAFQSVRGRSPN